MPVRVLVATGKITAVAACFLAVTAASGYFTMRMVQLGALVTVPDVTGRTLEEAGEILAPMVL